jgi:hypothetical protein
MFNRASLITVCGALLGLALAAATVSAAANRIEYLSFNVPVGLPGVTLGTGTYVFEVANPDSAADIIRVRNKTTNQVCFLGFTHRVERPARLSEARSVVFGEAPAGIAPPILQWYPVGETVGHEFVYNNRR